ncbi:hypothetical protein GZL_00213 [Streptomyces sp. 769]|nr:hypothetical protein GZL_00213 [Streptomyces sp. 769]
MQPGRFHARDPDQPAHGGLLRIRTVSAVSARTAPLVIDHRGVSAPLDSSARSSARVAARPVGTRGVSESSAIARRDTMPPPGRSGSSRSQCSPSTASPRTVRVPSPSTPATSSVSRSQSAPGGATTSHGPGASATGPGTGSSGHSTPCSRGSAGAPSSSGSQNRCRVNA